MKKLTAMHKPLFILFLALSISLGSCSSDEDDPKDQTFLEHNDGTKWEAMFEGLRVYVRINNSVTNPLETWLFNPIAECYEYQDGSVNTSVEILENSENRLVVEFTDEPGEYAVLTVVSNNDMLNLKIENYEDDVLVETTNLSFEASNVNLSDLEICGDAA